MTMIQPKTLMLAAALGALASGCVSNDADSGMRILFNAAAGDACLVDGSTDTFIGSGTIDSASGIGYVFTPVVINDIVTLEGELTGPKTIYIEGANVDIAFYDSDTFSASDFQGSLLSFAVPTSGSIGPNGGRSGFAFEIVPPELLAAMHPTIVELPSGVTTLDVRVQMFGTRGGGEITSQTFRYPVQVCAGCLVEDVGACALLDPSFEAATGGTCNPAQDAILECCDNFMVCPAMPPPMP